MNESVFFLMVPQRVGDVFTCEMVHCTGEERPYLTKTKNGLAVTRTQCSMFMYTPGNEIAKYVDDPRRCGTLRGDVHLRPDQIELLDKAIATNYFFS
jgi:hypothetical protein